MDTAARSIAATGYVSDPYKSYRRVKRSNILA